MHSIPAIESDQKQYAHLFVCDPMEATEQRVRRFGNHCDREVLRMLHDDLNVHNTYVRGFRTLGELGREYEENGRAVEALALKLAARRRRAKISSL